MRHNKTNTARMHLHGEALLFPPPPRSSTEGRTCTARRVAAGDAIHDMWRSRTMLRTRSASSASCSRAAAAADAAAATSSTTSSPGGRSRPVSEGVRPPGASADRATGRDAAPA